MDLDSLRRKAEAKLGREMAAAKAEKELNELREDMERQRCVLCNMGGGQHFAECPKAGSNVYSRHPHRSA